MKKFAPPHRDHTTRVLVRFNELEITFEPRSDDLLAHSIVQHAMVRLPMPNELLTVVARVGRDGGGREGLCR